MSDPINTTRKVLRRGDPTQSGTRRVRLREATGGDGRQFPLGFLPEGTPIADRYRVIETLHPHETSHPGIYVGEGPEGEVVIKVAATEHPPNPELWAKLTSLVHPNVLRVFRTFEFDGRFFEIQELCEGGSLIQHAGNSSFNDTWFRKRFVPQVLDGLRFLHENDIVHRDLKPANLFLRKGHINSDILLGDFDISSVLQVERTSRGTTRAQGTWEYTAPEAFPRFVEHGVGYESRITRAADFYALGITIVELLTGTNPLRSCDLPDLFDFYLGGGKVQLPECHPHLATLIKGLLIRDRRKRWGAEQLTRWLKDDLSKADLASIAEDERFSFQKAVPPYSLGNYQVHDLKSLADAIELRPEEAKEHLLESDLLTQWVSAVDTNVAQRIDRTREQYRRDPEHAIYRAMLVCDPDRPYRIPDVGDVRTPEEWLQAIANSNLSEHQLELGPTSELSLKKLEAWLELKRRSDRGSAAEVSMIRLRPGPIRFEELAYLFEPKLPYSGTVSAFQNLRADRSEWRGGHTFKDLALQALGEVEDWASGLPSCFTSAKNRWNAGFLEAWVRQRGLEEPYARAMQAASLLKQNLDEGFDVLIRQLYPLAPKPMISLKDGSLTSVWNVPHGSKRELRIAYTSSGFGIPVGNLRLKNEPPGMRLKTGLLKGRKGVIVLEFDAQSARVRSGSVQEAVILADRGNFAFEDDRISVPYQVSRPNAQALTRIGIGAALGGTILGLSRLTISGIFPRVASQNGYNPFEFLNNDDVEMFSGFEFLFALIVVLLGFYLVFKLWTEAIKRFGV